MIRMIRILLFIVNRNKMMREMLRILVVCHVFFSVGRCQAAAGEANEPLNERIIQTRTIGIK